MNQLLTKNGCELIRYLTYSVKHKKYSLERNGISSGDYKYQAIQQREIAIDDVFERLITAEADKLKDSDVINYYEYLAKQHKTIIFNFKRTFDWQDYITETGMKILLEIYERELKAMQATWHDQIFYHMPDLESITDLKKCTVNVNYLERLQGYKMIMSELCIPLYKILNINDDIFNHIYTLKINDNGSSYYKELK